MNIPENYEYYTYAEFEQAQETEEKFKLEYDNGLIHYMSPVYPNHERVNNYIANKLTNSIGFNGPCEVFTSDVAVVFENDKSKHEFEPDIMICCDPSKFVKAKYKGIPALVVEILSHSTESRDKDIKHKVYQSFGVPEYWIVDINGRSISVFNNNVDGIYTTTNIYSTGKQFTSFNNIEFTVDNIFAVLK